jgi:hypothetical protein
MDYNLRCVRGEIQMQPSKVIKQGRGSRVPRGKKILQVFLDEELHRQFKAYAALHGLSMSEIVVNSVKGMMQINEARYSRSKYERKK